MKRKQQCHLEAPPTPNESTRISPYQLVVVQFELALALSDIKINCSKVWIRLGLSSRYRFPSNVDIPSLHFQPRCVRQGSELGSKATMSFDFAEHPHRRYNPLSGKWVLVSPHRAKRPWQGAVEEIAPDNRPEYDPNDYLGPGNSRVGGTKQNPPYTDTFVFDNDFQALLDSTPAMAMGEPGKDLLATQAVRGKCRVVCFSPKLNVTVAEMDVAALRKVVDAWVEEYKHLGSLDYINHVQIFENKGEMMGCSNPHPHGQIWSSEMIPEEPDAELRNLRKYREDHDGKGMLEDYVALETADKSRVVTENDSFIVVVPFWAVWPFETLVISKSRIGSLLDCDDKAKTDLADIYRRITCRYDNLFKCSFPYSMGVHQAPTDGHPHPEAHLHLHFYPPLLRSATVRKFMVGFELLGEAQRDLTAEQAAARLRDCPEVHYRHSKTD